MVNLVRGFAAAAPAGDDLDNPASGELENNGRMRYFCEDEFVR